MFITDDTPKPILFAAGDFGPMLELTLPLDIGDAISEVVGVPELGGGEVCRLSLGNDPFVMILFRNK